MYVASKESSERIAKRDFTKKDIEHETMYINVPFNQYSSLVRNSHQYPRGDYNPIKPYQQKQIKGSKLQKDIDTTPVYFGSKRYTRANCPNKLQAHWE
jgi:hypothetical protein